MGISLGWPIARVNSFFTAESVMITGRSISTVPASGRRPESATINSLSYEELYMKVPVMACLNAAGGVKFVYPRARSSTQTCSPKISATHTSGVSLLRIGVLEGGGIISPNKLCAAQTPRNILLSMSGTLLVLGYASAVRVYGVTHNMAVTEAYSAATTFLYKVLHMSRLHSCVLYRLNARNCRYYVCLGVAELLSVLPAVCRRRQDRAGRLSHDPRGPECRERADICCK